MTRAIGFLLLNERPVKFPEESGLSLSACMPECASQSESEMAQVAFTGPSTTSSRSTRRAGTRAMSVA